MKNKILFLTVCAITLCSWHLHTQKPIEKAHWLIGTWESKMSRGSIYENWIPYSDTELHGKSYMLGKKDTMVFEQIRIVQENDSLFYIPQVKKQNKGLPVRFALTTLSETQLIFENPKHDFPQVIAYTRITADSMVAEISGTKDDKVQKQTFPMKRIK